MNSTPPVLALGQAAWVAGFRRPNLVQDVFLLLLRELPSFDYNPRKSFHVSLKIVFLNRHRQRARSAVPVQLGQNGQERSAMPANLLEEQEYRHYLIRQAYQLIEREFTPLPRQVFQEYAIHESSPEEVAQE